MNCSPPVTFWTIRHSVQHDLPLETIMAIARAKKTKSPKNDINDFHEQLKAILPRLRVYALSLTRDRGAADDLVHATAIKALTGCESFEPGTNLSAWVFRIQRNEFISGLRRMRPSVPVDSAIAETLSHQPHQESRLVMREFMSAFGKLAPTPREALWLAVLEGQSHEVIAAHTGVSVGTVKSRISRARDMLERLLLEGGTNRHVPRGIGRAQH